MQAPLDSKQLPPSGTSLKYSVEGKSSRRAELQAVKLTVLFAWEEKRPDV